MTLQMDDKECSDLKVVKGVQWPVEAATAAADVGGCRRRRHEHRDDVSR